MLGVLSLVVSLPVMAVSCHFEKGASYKSLFVNAGDVGSVTAGNGNAASQNGAQNHIYGIEDNENITFDEVNCEESASNTDDIKNWLWL